MIGDKIIIREEHRRAAEVLFGLLEQPVRDHEGTVAITIGGESGSGKSELAAALAERLVENGLKTEVFQQDDYFVYPPKTNAEMREQDISRVGMSEVRLELLNEHLKAAQEGKGNITKPLVIYKENRITEETVNLRDVQVVIAEGTYTTTLTCANTRVFIDRTYRETKKARLERAREEDDPYLERILEIEHGIISAQKKNADFVITSEFDVIRQSPGGAESLL